MRRAVALSRCLYVQYYLKANFRLRTDSGLSQLAGWPPGRGAGRKRAYTLPRGLYEAFWMIMGPAILVPRGRFAIINNLAESEPDSAAASRANSSPMVWCLVKIRTTQVEPTLRTAELAAMLFQLSRAVRAEAGGAQWRFGRAGLGRIWFGIRCQSRRHDCNNLAAAEFVFKAELHVTRLLSGSAQIRRGRARADRCSRNAR